MIDLIIVAAVILLGGGATITIVGFNKGWFIPGKNKIELGVFGLPQTGKTLFFNCLKNKWGMETEQTTIQGVESFVVNLNGTRFKFKGTTDIGGGDPFFLEHAEKLIEKCDFIVYFCNIHDYMNKKEIAEKDRARMDFIKSRMSIYGIKDENVRIVLSYADMVDDRNDAYKYFVNSIANERFSSFRSNVVAVNMTNEKEVKEMIKIMFYGGKK